MTKMICGIASVAEQRARSLAIASGTRTPGKDEPNVWFPSVSAMNRILSEENMEVDCIDGLIKNCTHGPAKLRVNFHCPLMELNKIETELTKQIRLLCQHWRNNHGDY